MLFSIFYLHFSFDGISNDAMLIDKKNLKWDKLDFRLPIRGK
jgi:hypothetical protein